MKVLHFYKTYLPDTVGGLERTIWEIAEGVSRRGVETHVLSLSRNPPKGPIVIGHHTAHKTKLDFSIARTDFSRSAFGAFARLARTVDVIHYHFPYPFADVVHFATRPGKPFVVTYHSDIVRQKMLKEIYRPLMHVFLGHADRIVATSPNYAATSPVLRAYAGKTSIIPITVDTDAAAKADPALLESWRARLPPRFFFFLGALRYYKGLQFLLDAAGRTGFPVVIAGVGEDAEQLRNDAARRGLQNVRFLGPVSDTDKAALLALCYAFVFPSQLRSEAFGVALLEAAAAGKPLISCEIGTGTSYVNEAGTTGLVVAPADSAAFGDAMQRLWNDPGEATRMGKAARLRAATTFSADAMANAYTALYGELAPHAR